MDYRYGSHAVFNIEYHFVWVTKYRYKVLTGDVATRVRELVRQIWEIFETRIIKGVVSKDHIPVLVSAPPTMAPSEIRNQTSRQTYQKQRLTLLKTQNNTCGLCGVSFWPRDPIDDHHLTPRHKRGKRDSITVCWYPDGVIMRIINDQDKAAET